MKRIGFLLLSLLALSFNGYAQHALCGDVNGDLEVTISDINSVINIILDKGDITAAADVNNDGEVTLADVNVIIGIILGGGYGGGSEDGVVDLGLPSGTLWATCNVGADAPEEYGDFFAWGETAPKDYYDWRTYQWCNGSQYALTKYCAYTGYGDNGFADFKTELDLEDDAAYVNMGALWRTPSFEQMQELIEHCTMVFTQRNGVRGCLVIGPNSKTMFLPAAGNRWQNEHGDEGLYGIYWTSMCHYNDPFYAFFFNFDTDDRTFSNDFNYRSFGFTVRPVRASRD